jgi:hypothetical protein
VPLIAMGRWIDRRAHMPQISKGILAAAAFALSLGAVPFAFGQDTAGLAGASGTAPASGAAPASGTAPSDINRAAKADRAAVAVVSGPQTQTISLRFEELSDTSVLIRIPVADAGNRSSARPPAKSSDHRLTVACEPVVSVLTEVAKRLQPGRCVT